VFESVKSPGQYFHASAPWKIDNFSIGLLSYLFVVSYYIHFQHTPHTALVLSDLLQWELCRAFTDGWYTYRTYGLQSGNGLSH